jgi:hypothetical protein
VHDSSKKVLEFLFFPANAVDVFCRTVRVATLGGLPETPLRGEPVCSPAKDGTFCDVLNAYDQPTCQKSPQTSS